MSPRKLSDLDREEIVSLYRTTEETTSTLANRYGVSSSTVSRFLKSQLSDAEYEGLIQQKRLARHPGEYTKNAVQIPLEFEMDISLPDKSFEQEAKEDEIEEFVEPVVERKKIETSLPIKKADREEKPPQKEVFIEEKETFFEELLGEEDDDIEDLDDEDDDWEEDDWEEELEVTIPEPLPKNVSVKVLPLSEATLPKTCYLVIDRSAELITRPLKEFAHLGKIPQEEVQEKTLPIFDNQRIAKRFSNRTQRVIKVPDGRIFKKTSPYLKAKGITRLLINGQVYSLSPL